MSVFVDQKLEVEWVDDETLYGPIFKDGGNVGLRTMDYTEASVYHDLSIYKIGDTQSSTDIHDVAALFFKSYPSQ